MWPRSQEGTVKYRRRLRQREISLVIDTIRRDFSASVQGNGDVAPRILEFGAGGGHQVPFLRQLGSVVASDVYVDKGLDLGELRVPYAVADISRSPFADGSFDVIFSNHVLEHIPDVDRALDEVQRIGKAECLYVFVVPTSLWIFLSVPSRYMDRVKRVFGRLGRLVRPRPRPVSEWSVAGGVERPAGKAAGRGLAAWLRPGGHGEYPGFWSAVSAFRRSVWENKFARHGLDVAGHHHLLLYATARWPIIPMNRLFAPIGLVSSRLFILKRQRSA